MQDEKPSKAADLSVLLSDEDKFCYGLNAGTSHTESSSMYKRKSWGHVRHSANRCWVCDVNYTNHLIFSAMDKKK